jgi:hypothetical protein
MANTTAVKILEKKLPNGIVAGNDSSRVRGVLFTKVRDAKASAPLPQGKLAASPGDTPELESELVRRLIVSFRRQMMMMTPVFLPVGIIRKSCPAPDWEE